MVKKNLLYVQSGGVTSVINASACGVIETARLNSSKIANIYAASYGIGGLLKENIYDLTNEDGGNIALLMHTPGGIFGSCRHRMKDITKDDSEYSRLYEIFKAHNIGYFFYNGGGGSMDAANKIAIYCKDKGLDIICLGIPKTIDNDLDYMDNCPGYASVAKFTATATLESGLDASSMHTTSTKVLLMEVMGRHAGWIAAAAGLAYNTPAKVPHLIIFPEVPLNKMELMGLVDKCVKQHGYCVLVVAEGARNERGDFISMTLGGIQQLGGAANILSVLINQLLGYKYHCVVCDYLQRSARHLSSQVDVDHAYGVGKAAVEYAVSGHKAVMPIITRISSYPYKWKLEKISLAKVANSERLLPSSYIGKDKYSINEEAKEHIMPLIQGEAYPPYEGGLPLVASRDFILLKKKLPHWN